MDRFKVFFDGGCVVCASEIGLYRRMPGAERIDWVDIDAPGFDAAASGVDPREVNQVFHVRDEEGGWHKGVDAFIAIWRRIPLLRPFALASRIPGAKALLKAGYAGFVRARPYLPRRRSDCAADRCARG